MAIKAIAMVKNFNFGSSGFYVYVDIFTDDNQYAFGVISPELSPAATDITLDSDLKNFVKEYCEEEFDIEFGLFDNVRVLFKFNSIV